MDQVPTARDCMATDLFTVAPEIDVFDAIDLLLSRHASGVPVVDEDKRLVGILTEKDCLRVLSNSTWGLLASGKVRNYMSPVRMVVEANQDLFTVACIFLEGNFPSLPVIEDNRLVGRISRRDVLRGIQALERACSERKIKAQRDLKLKQSPSSIENLQILAGSQRREHLAALFRMRHDSDNE